MDRIKLTFCCADTASDTLVRIHHGSTTAKTTRCLDLHLLLGQCLMCITEGSVCINLIIHCRTLSLCIVISFERKIFLIQFDKLTAVSSDRHARIFMDKTVNGLCTFFSGCDCIDCKARSGIDISTNKNIRFCSLISKRICHSSVSSSKFHF